VKPGKTWIVPRTPEGVPDLQGVWNNATLTPFERAKEYEGKPFLTSAEAAEFEKSCTTWIATGATAVAGRRQPRL
jgi:hypothetical protein